MWQKYTCLSFANRIYAHIPLQFYNTSELPGMYINNNNTLIICRLQQYHVIKCYLKYMGNN